jgi:hypothetical protein
VTYSLKKGMVNQKEPRLVSKILTISRWQIMLKLRKLLLSKDQICNTIRKVQLWDIAEGVAVKSFVKITARSNKLLQRII